MLLITFLVPFSALLAEKPDEPSDNPTASREFSPGKVLENDGSFRGNYHVGHLGFTIEIKATTNHCLVTDVVSGLAADKAGLEEGDKITRIAGKKVSDYSITYHTFTSSPLQDFGRAMQKSSSLAISVERKGSTKRLTIKQDIEKYGDIANGRCKRANKEAADCLDYLADAQDGDNKWGAKRNRGVVQSALCCLVFLNQGDSAGLAKVKKWLRNFRSEKAIETHIIDSHSTWGYNYLFTVQAEYYLRTKDKKVLKSMEYVLDVLQKRTAPNGRHGHEEEVSYEGRGINAITSHVYLNFVLAEKCGLEVDPAKKKATLAHLVDSQSDEGAIKYNNKSNSATRESFYRTSLFAIAAYHDGESKLARKSLAFLDSRSEDAMSGHALAQFSLFWHSCAVSLGRSSSLKKHLENWNWMFQASTAHRKAKNISRYYIPAAKNDYYMADAITSHAVTAGIFTIHKKNLFILGKK